MRNLAARSGARAVASGIVTALTPDERVRLEDLVTRLTAEILKRREGPATRAP